MKIEVKIVKENEDGSAEALVNFDKEGLGLLIQEGLVSILTQAVNEYKAKPQKSNKRIKKDIK